MLLDLISYQWKCFEILYNHFHKVIECKRLLIKELTEEDKKLLLLEEELKNSKTYQDFEKQKKKIKEINKQLNKQEKDYRQTQINFFNNKD